MKRIVTIVIVLAVATLIGVALQADNGYVLLRYQHTAIEMSLVAFVFLGILVFIVLYFLVRFLLRLRRARRRLGENRGNKGQRHLSRYFINGMISVAEGQWEKGEKQILRNVEGSDMALLQYLAAARSAQVRGADEQRDEYLHKAYEIDKKSRLAVLLNQAELQIEHRQFELALATLRRIQELKPHHVHALRLLARLYKELGDYQQLHDLVRSLRSYHALDADKIDAIELDSTATLMTAAAARHDTARLEKLWQGLPRHLRSQPTATRAYAQALIQANAHDKAETFIRAQLKADWDDELARLYGLVRSNDPAPLLGNAEHWLKQHDDSALLLLTAGRLAMACELWGKARTYLENSTHYGKCSAAYTELGHLLESQGEESAAAEAYKAALPSGTCWAQE